MIQTKQTFSNGVPITKRIRRALSSINPPYDGDGRLLLKDKTTLSGITSALAKDCKNLPGSGTFNAFGLMDAVLRTGLDSGAGQIASDFYPEIYRIWKDLDSEGLATLERNLTTAFPRGEGLPQTPAPEPLVRNIILLWLFTKNPALKPFVDLFDSPWLKRPVFRKLISRTHQYFDEKPGFGEEKENLLDYLRKPALAHPDSLEDQLAYIRTHWASWLGDLLSELLLSLDLLKEEFRGAPGGPGPIQLPDYGSLMDDKEQFSPDKDWMPRVVLIAKSTLVWLDQLSKTYGRAITRLDQIPDEELDILASRGFTSLWLIGLWERSSASARIKTLCGNPEAAPSAYSLFNYEIAGELGGWEALENLRYRCWTRGIRMASDMVPNHTGIDSAWMHQDPDLFLSLDHPPYPGYTYNGENLSTNPDVGIYLEDHYYDKTDAAVTFKRVDFRTGDTRYIYHGNDGTHMPWNDTAQLNYADARVRETVIQTILHVAKNFPVIRFDAAMTLARKHVRRLWFPEPGGGGAIPSRALHGMTNEEFFKAVPGEFWREVVDRIAAEAPDTLLLAEAFWMMEGYFVRTLGMHRVYNSAFMHMMKNEDNAKYRNMIKETLAFDPRILQRYVNFMNNPDEETAAEQFGTGDKYIGVCLLMSALPGLPMFGHGQFEGFREKYGMEYRKAYHAETPDQHLLDRHAGEISPVLKTRYRFAGVEKYRLYDLIGHHGAVQENAYVFSNEYYGEKVLFAYNNAYDRAAGWIRTSAPWATTTGLRKDTIGQALGLSDNPRAFTLLKNFHTGETFIRSSREILSRGFFFQLDGFQYLLLSDIREVIDDEMGHYRNLAEELDGKPCSDFDTVITKRILTPVHTAWEKLIEEKTNPEATVRFLGAVTPYLPQNVSPEALIESLGRTEVLLSVLEEAKPSANPGWKDFLSMEIQIYPGLHRWIRLYAAAAPLSRAWKERDGLSTLMDQWRLDLLLLDNPRALKTDGQIYSVMRILDRAIRIYLNIAPKDRTPKSVLTAILKNPEIDKMLQLNRHRDIIWYNGEAFEEFCTGFLLSLAATTGPDSPDLPAAYDCVRRWITADRQAGYQIEKLLEQL